MKTIAFVFAIILVAAPSFGDSHSKISPTILSLLKAHNSKVNWDKMIGQGDVNCDGVEDYIVKGNLGNRLYVAVVLGPLTQKSRVSSINIGLGNEKYQDSLLEKNPSIKIVTLDYDAKEMSGFDVEGFERSNKCKGIELGGEESDEINVYWNHKMDRLNWWRL